MLQGGLEGIGWTVSSDEVPLKAARQLLQAPAKISCEVLTQHGDETAPDHWTYHRIRVVDRGVALADQPAHAESAGYKSTSLRGRSFLNILNYLGSKFRTDSPVEARTSTLTLDNGNPRRERPSIVGWTSFYLFLYHMCSPESSHGAGLAVGIPAGSSQPSKSSSPV